MPYVKWHGRDWLGDPLLRMVGHEARGVWIDLLCVMMQAEPYGHLAVAGKPMSNEQMARMIGVDMPTFIPLLMAIEGAGISSRTADGVLYSRRLVRDYDQFMRFSNAGKKGGGNPALRKSAPLASPSEEEARSQKPEAKGSIKGGYKPTFIGEKLPESLMNIGGFSETWQAYLENRLAKKAKATPKAQALILKRLAERPDRAVNGLQEAIMRNWTGFNWEWLEPKNGFAAKPPPPKENWRSIETGLLDPDKDWSKAPPIPEPKR
jgi:hypothetical protein